MADEGFKRKLAAILSADVEGFSWLIGEDEGATSRTPKSYRLAIAELVKHMQFIHQFVKEGQNGEENFTNGRIFIRTTTN
jgi:hypothetical protein